MRRSAGILLILCIGPVIFLTGCQLAAPAPEPSPVAVDEDDPYRAAMLRQGFVELVGDDLAAKPMADDPTQIDLGGETYRQVCLACHGDWGQGLTDEWRAEWGEDSNCWQAKCHAASHPPQGFSLPREVPPLLGSTALASFETASDLQQSVAQTMPWWNPASMTEEEAWGLTAYLMSQRGELADDITLDEGNGAIYQLHVPYAPVEDYRPGAVFLIGLLVVAAVTLLWRIQ